MTRNLRSGDLSSVEYEETLVAMSAEAPDDVAETMDELVFHLRRLRPIFEEAEQSGEVPGPQEIADATSVETALVFREIVMIAAGHEGEHGLMQRVSDAEQKYCT